MMNLSTCQKLANIIGGEVIQAKPVCVVMRLRDIKATILNRRTRSPLALPFALSFENNGLNLGESVVLQKEINPFMMALQKRGLIVTAVHNHWLFDEPRLMYMHWENAEKWIPLSLLEIVLKQQKKQVCSKSDTIYSVFRHDKTSALR